LELEHLKVFGERKRKTNEKALWIACPASNSMVELQSLL
jgi:hypothetical protein